MHSISSAATERVCISLLKKSLRQVSYKEVLKPHFFYSTIIIISNIISYFLVFGGNNNLMGTEYLGAVVLIFEHN